MAEAQARAEDLVERAGLQSLRVPWRGVAGARGKATAAGGPMRV
jgi:hypothetical protein